MTGGRIQLSAYGEHDKFLTGNPQITYFMSIYKRYTNFSIESIEQLFTGNIDYGQQIYCTPSIIGDLLSDITLQLKLPSLKKDEINNFYISWVNSIGNAIINYIDIEIGNQLIDRHYGQWLEIWHELILPDHKKKAYNKMVGKSNNFSCISFEEEITLYVPMCFWFCKNPGLSIPLISLQNHEVKFVLNLKKFEDLWVSSTGLFYKNYNQDDFPIITGSLICDYIFLDTDERKIFSKSKHEYLITQLQTEVQSLDTNLSNNIIQLNFNNPVKELIWVYQFANFLRSKPGGGKECFNFTNESITSINSPSDYIESTKLLIEGQDRIKHYESSYFNLLQQYNYHTNVALNKYINIYSFSLFPENNKPSGTINFSMIDNKNLVINLHEKLSDLFIYSYAINYNVLKINSGMATLEYF